MNLLMKTKRLISKTTQKSGFFLVGLAVFVLLATVFYQFNLENSLDDEDDINLDIDRDPQDQSKRLKSTGNSRISLAIADVIKKSSQLDFTLFVVDPEALMEVITEYQHKNLLAKKMLPEINKFDKRLFTFGVFEKDIDGVEELSEALVKEGYTLKKIIGEDGSKRHLLSQLNTTNSRSVVPVHYLLQDKQGNDKPFIQIVVFYQRNHWFWTGKLDKNTLEEMPKPVHFGQEEGAFDLFNLTKIIREEDAVEVFVPEPTDHFLSQISSSHFIECDHETARWFLLYEMKPSVMNVTDWIEVNRNVSRKLLSVIIKMKSLMKRVKTPFWIGSDTLLGWYRNCGGTVFSDDYADFGTWSEYVSINFTEYLIMKQYQTELTTRFILGLPKVAYEYRMIDNDTSYWAHLAYYYPENKTHVYTTKQFVENEVNEGYVKLFYRRFELCSGELLGYKLLVPCDPLNTIILPQYGSDWKHPYVLRYGKRHPVFYMPN